MKARQIRISEEPSYSLLIEDGEQPINWTFWTEQGQSICTGITTMDVPPEVFAVVSLRHLIRINEMPDYYMNGTWRQEEQEWYCHTDMAEAVVTPMPHTPGFWHTLVRTTDQTVGVLMGLSDHSLALAWADAMLTWLLKALAVNAT